MVVANRIKVLVVEDELLVRVVTRELVEDCGYEVIEALDAADAISALEHDPEIRIVLTDINMPGSIDGLALAKTIRNRWPPIELIVSSGKMRLSEHDLPERARFLAKPFSHVDLSSMLNDFARSASH